MPPARPNIHELARLSGVSVGTVSRALNGYTDVRAETRERIMRIAQELDYTPSASARTLVTQRSHVVGVFLETGEGHPDFQHPFFHEVLGGIKQSAGPAGYDLLVFASERPGNGFGRALLPQALPPPQRRRRGPHGPRRRRSRGAPARALRRRLRSASTSSSRARSPPPSPPTTRPARPPPSAISTSSATAGSPTSRACSTSARAQTACAAIARSCSVSASRRATSTCSTATSTSRAGTARCRHCSRSTSRRPRSSPPRT